MNDKKTDKADKTTAKAINKSIDKANGKANDNAINKAVDKLDVAVEIIIDVKIEKLTLGGYGLARHEGLVVFVNYAAPGDHLRVRLTEKKKNLAYAEIVQILQASADRREPPCPVFGVCGGCQWQHINYPEQLRQKENIVREQLSRVTSSDTIWHPIQASPHEWEYRNRIQIHLLENAWGFKKDVAMTSLKRKSV